MSDDVQQGDEGNSKDVTRRAVLMAAGATGIAVMAGEAVADQPQSEGKFNSNRLTFDEGIERIKKATAPHTDQMAGKIITSRDPNIGTITDALKVENLPSGFVKWQLPVYFQGVPGAQFFLTAGTPNAKVGTHSHNADGIRFILNGSIHYDGKELTGGDWMFIPKDAPYSFDVGPKGVTMAYCYSCCCA
jgi:hypothetical protein